MIKLIITDNAWLKMFNVIKNNINNSFMLSASSGGCNGFNYNFKIITDDNYNDILKQKPIIETKNNVNVLIDPRSEFLLLGTTIDYLKQDLNKGIFEGKFVFIPDKKLAISCGCGTSFNYKN